MTGVRLGGCPNALMDKAIGDRTWDNRSEAGRCVNTARPLTHLIDSSDRQDEMKATCSIDGCDRPLFRRELCNGHYGRVRRTGSPGSADFRPQRTGQRECKQPNCDRIVGTSGGRDLCGAHYQRWLMHGDPGTEPIKVKGVKVPCSVEDCERHARSNGFCRTHYSRWRKWGDPLCAGNPSRSGPRPDAVGPQNNNWVGDSIGYAGTHRRVSRQKGQASLHQCQHCGSQAKEWAYDHGDPGEKLSGKGHPYSADIERYIPLCIPCHRMFDQARIS